MIKQIDKNKERKKRRLRIRAKISGTKAVPRLNVFRSINEIYVQLINDEEGKTIAASSTQDKKLKTKLKDKNKTEQAKLVGMDIAQKAKALGVEKVVFDRAGYVYAGRIKSLADGAREAGLVF